MDPFRIISLIFIYSTIPKGVNMGKTIAEKIFDAHRVDSPEKGVHVLKLDRVFCHEITTPIAINDLVSRGMDRVFDPDKIKAVIDHVPHPPRIPKRRNRARL